MLYVQKRRAEASSTALACGDGPRQTLETQRAETLRQFEDEQRERQEKAGTPGIDLRFVARRPN